MTLHACFRRGLHDSASDEPTVEQLQHRWRLGVHVRICAALRCRDTAAASVAVARLADDSMQRVREASAGEVYRTAVEPLLPPAAGLLFHHHATCTPLSTRTVH